MLQSCASSPSGWWQLLCLTLGYSRIWWARARSPPRSLSPYACSHREPSTLLLLLLGAHILCTHLPAPSVTSNTSFNDAFPVPDSPADMQILLFPPNPLSSPPAQPPQTGKRVGSKQHSSTQQTWRMLEKMCIFYQISLCITATEKRSG